jgi:hypothetical protein
MRQTIWIVAAIAALAVGLGEANAQGITAEVRTWAGQTYRISEPSLEVLYTILVKKEGAAAQGSEATPAPTTGNRSPQLFGTASQISTFLDKQPDPLQGNRQSESITLRKDGGEVRVPLTDLTSLTFTRQPVRSTLPPYAATEHFRYGAIAVLKDGSRLEGDYVSLGTTSLRGRTAQGKVDIPWDQIESIRFTR